MEDSAVLTAWMVSLIMNLRRRLFSIVTLPALSFGLANGSLKGRAWIFPSFLYIGRVIVLLWRQPRKAALSAWLIRFGWPDDPKGLQPSLPYVVPMVLGTLSAYGWSDL